MSDAQARAAFATPAAQHLLARGGALAREEAVGGLSFAFFGLVGPGHRHTIARRRRLFN